MNILQLRGLSSRLREGPGQGRGKRSAEEEKRRHYERQEGKQKLGARAPRGGFGLKNQLTGKKRGRKAQPKGLRPPK